MQAVTTDIFGTEIDTSALVDIEYMEKSDRQTVKSGSFSRVADYQNELEAGDKILFFQTQDNIDQINETMPMVRLGVSQLGLCDGSSLKPILVTIKRIESGHAAEEGKFRNDLTLYFEEFGGSWGAYYKQIWRYVG